MNYLPPHLPLPFDIETKNVLKKTALARDALAELRGIVASIPNQSMLLNTLSLQEAKDSSAIENIITTHDDLYRSDTVAREFASPAAKEVHNYATALKNGYKCVKTSGLLTNNHIIEIQSTLESNNAGFRKQAGTSLKNDQTGEIVFTPPQNPKDIEDLMSNLEAFINDDMLSDWDPLIKMAVIHHQFETIHPFYDGNGRTGRIINILYLVKQGLLKTPVLYLSRFINQNKAEYYRLLQKTREANAWEEWILYMLDGVEKTSHQTSKLVQDIKRTMQAHKLKLRRELPNVYSQDLLNNLFSHPYTKIDFVTRDLQVHRNTATRYLDEIVKIGLLSKHKIGKENFYLNDALFDLLRNAGVATG